MYIYIYMAYHATNLAVSKYTCCKSLLNHFAESSVKVKAPNVIPNTLLAHTEASTLLALKG